jgi:hypothetical protein
MLGHMYSIGEDIFLKFTTPDNNWGTTGQPNYRLGTESDGCICPSEFTTVQIINDPYINKPVYGCKLNKLGKEKLTLFNSTDLGSGLNIIVDTNNGTINNTIYQLYYQKSMGKIGCTSFELKIDCDVKISPRIDLILNNLNELIVSTPTVSGGVAPYNYNWEIISQEGFFNSYTLSVSMGGDTPSILPPLTTPFGSGSITIKLTVTDANGCSDFTTLSYNKSR